MRILILSGHFSPEVGYQEVYWARELTRAGYRVKVLSTTSVSNSVKTAIGKESYEPGITTIDGYEVERLKVLFEFRTILFSVGVKERLRVFNPDLVISIGVAKFMPFWGVIYKDKFNYRLVSLFSDTSLFKFEGRTLRKRAESLLIRLGFALVKKPWYLYTFRRSDKIVAATPETEEVLLSPFPSKREEIKQKVQFIPLGFDEKEFYFDPHGGRELRRQYGISDDAFVIVTATKMAPYKSIELFLKAVKQLLDEGLDLHMFLIGFGSDDYSKSLRQWITAQPFADRIHCEGFQSHNRLRCYYNAADLGMWGFHSITVQEAAGTGLMVLLPRTKVYSHLVVEGFNGSFFETAEELRQNICTIYQRVVTARAESETQRQEVMELNRRFSYRCLAGELVAGIESINPMSCHKGQRRLGE
jgi:glycosyltransferase involved in cell wall biosynthesis